MVLYDHSGHTINTMVTVVTLIAAMVHTAAPDHAIIIGAHCDDMS